MKISPVNIKKQEFNKKVRGYDVDEVKAFLENLAEEISIVLSENESLKSELLSAQEKLVEYRKIEKSLQDTLVKAQDTTSKAIENSKKQAGVITREAEIKAEQIIEKAKENADGIRNAVIHLREEKELIVAKLKAIINTQAHLLAIKVDEDDVQVQPGSLKEFKTTVHIDVDSIINKIS